ncbi:hypothetical protein L2E82_22578 [Cichorium intybus]|uniref:Uncharacterized protein n=1 Tax=Cichorium intybus TaxID=13427 RepID=A0ACB9DYF5_CICIN|nr:hypothetical protein L2E82_22578 [Cichorium intybus]
MYKNQLQELAQRSCFNLPSYTCIREGPDHAPRFKAAVNFNGETYESPNYCTTLRQAEHSAAEVALNELACRGPSNSLAARILDETGVYKNLLQEVSQRVGASLPTYTTFRSGLGHLPVFTCTVELAGCIFTGEPAKNKKQAEKNAAMSAWSSLKLLTQQSENFSLQKGNTEEQEHVIVARALQKFRLKARMTNIPFPIRFPPPKPKTLSTQSPPSTTSKILPLICPKMAQPRRKDNNTPQKQPPPPDHRLPKFPAIGAAPYIPVSHFRAHCGMAPPVTIRNAIPVFSAPPLPPPHMCGGGGGGIAPPVTIRQAVAPPTKPMTTSIPPENSKSLIKPTTTSALPTTTSALPTATSALPPQDKESNLQVTPITENEEASKSLEPGLKGLQI